MRPLGFNIKTHFDVFLVLIYAVDEEKAKVLLPAPLVHETHNGKAMMAIAFVKSKHFRPAFFPKWLGWPFNLAGFRHMASYTMKSGKTIRGLKIIRSAVNKKIMVKGGDQLTQYKFRYNPFSIEDKKGLITVRGEGINITAQETGGKEIPLPAGSVFESWTHARKFAGPLLYTFEKEKDQIIITKGNRKLWQPVPVEIKEAVTDFFNEAPYNDMNPLLSAAYIVKDIPYSWDKAVKEKI